MLRHRLIVGLADSSKIGAKLIIKRRHPLEQLLEVPPAHQLRARGLEHCNNAPARVISIRSPAATRFSSAEKLRDASVAVILVT